MAVPTSVTVPGVQLQRDGVASGGDEGEGQVGVPLLSPTSSAKGATGTSSGTLTSATSESVGGDHRGGLELAAGADQIECSQAAQEVGGGGDEPTLGHGDPDEHTVPCAVVAWSSTMERPAAWAAAGTAFCRAGQGGDGAAAAVSCVAAGRRMVRGGGQQDDEQATTAKTAPPRPGP